jgi:pimeloyl-ACP methyl ester carboxylesterase
MLREAMRQGPPGLASDWLAFVDVWGFELKDVIVPTTFFHGVHDQLEPAADADFAVAMVPDARLVEWSDAGHMGLIPHWREVLDSVA